MARAALLLFLSLSFSGCATTGRFWPSGEEWRKSAADAAKHPGTWAPLVGAAAVTAGGWDLDISDWAQRETPLFGSAQSAEDYSDGFRTAAHVGMIVSALAVHEKGRKYWPALLERMAWEHAGVMAAIGVREPIRRLTDRERPNGEPLSFPSGHSTTAFANAGMTYRNLEALHVDLAWEYGAKSVEAVFGVLTAWARVEAGKHYPTDVLVGAALGNFVALLVHDAFVGTGESVRLTAVPGGGVRLTFEGRF